MRKKSSPHSPTAMTRGEPMSARSNARRGVSNARQSRSPQGRPPHGAGLADALGVAAAVPARGAVGAGATGAGAAGAEGAALAQPVSATMKKRTSARSDNVIECYHGPSFDPRSGGCFGLGVVVSQA